jgi:hypothetical protein
MGLFQEEMNLSGMETTIYQWKEQKAKIQWIAVGMILVGIVANWLTSIEGRKLHLILWGIIFVVEVAFAVLDARLAGLIGKGEVEHYKASIEALDAKRKLEELGVASYNSDFDRQRVLMQEPEGKAAFSLAWYLICIGICLAFFLYYLAK